MHADGNAMHGVSIVNIHEYFYFYIYKTYLKSIWKINFQDGIQLII